MSTLDSHAVVEWGLGVLRALWQVTWQGALWALVVWALTRALPRLPSSACASHVAKGDSEPARDLRTKSPTTPLSSSDSGTAELYWYTPSTLRRVRCPLPRSRSITVRMVERASPWGSPNFSATSPTVAGPCSATQRSTTSSWSPTGFFMPLTRVTTSVVRNQGTP